MVNQEGFSVAAAAAEFGVGWHTANQAVAHFTDPHIDDPDRLEGVEAIGVDEKRFLNATPTARTRFTTQVVDLDRHRILEVMEGRSPKRAGRLARRTRRGMVCEDSPGHPGPLSRLPPRPPRTPPECHLGGGPLPHHSPSHQAIDDVRRGVQNQTLGHRGRKGDPLYRARRVLLTADERLTEERFQWMASLLAVGDPDGEVSATWVAKELLREVFSAADEAHARRRMIAFYTYCAEADVPELSRLARTISRWSEHIFAYHRTGRASNGRIENAHMLTEKIRRDAHGFRNIHNYRRRIIGRLGIKWHTELTRRIRGRQPRFIA